MIIIVQLSHHQALVDGQRRIPDDIAEVAKQYHAKVHCMIPGIPSVELQSFFALEVNDADTENAMVRLRSLGSVKSAYLKSLDLLS